MGRASTEYFKRLQLGLCTECGEPNDRQGRALCSACATKLYNSQTYYMKQKGVIYLMVNVVDALKILLFPVIHFVRYV